MTKPLERIGYVAVRLKISFTNSHLTSPGQYNFGEDNIIRVINWVCIRSDSIGTHQIIIKAETAAGEKQGECSPQTFMRASGAKAAYKKVGGVWGSADWRKDMNLRSDPFVRLN